MRPALWLFLLGILLPCAAAAQETRGNISGTVRDEQGVVPGASVKITNVDTQVSQNLVTNDSGYFEAPLLNPGTYEVTVADAGLQIRDAQQHRARRRPAVDRTVHARGRPDQRRGRGQGGDAAARHQLVVLGRELRQPSRREPADVLEHADHAVALLARRERQRCADAGVAGLRGQHVAVGGLLLGLPLAGTQNPLTPPVGGNNYTIDGANNNGSNRRIAASPNSDMIQEMRVESANFDASVGHGLGLQISMMTRAGTNTHRGTVNYQVPGRTS